MSDTECTWCTRTHDMDFLCAPAKEVLHRLHEKSLASAESYDMPTVELTNEEGQDIEGVLVKAFGVRAFYTLTLGVYRPGIAIDPILLDDSRTKPLILIDDDVTMRRAGRLFDDMTSLAVRRARRARDEAFKHRSI